jgi:hypothetical protein
MDPSEWYKHVWTVKTVIDPRSPAGTGLAKDDKVRFDGPTELTMRITCSPTHGAECGSDWNNVVCTKKDATTAEGNTKGPESRSFTIVSCKSSAGEEQLKCHFCSLPPSPASWTAQAQGDTGRGGGGRDDR